MEHLDNVYDTYMGVDIWVHQDTTSGVFTYYIIWYGRRITASLPQLRSHIARLVGRKRQLDMMVKINNEDQR